jgi:S-(hydroxymethyl)glutathione dehydrogenase/alcohol dehydrogenase
VTGVLPLRLPCVLGHEGAGSGGGGEGVTRLSRGDAVVLSWITPAAPATCRIGRVSLCDLGAQINLTSLMPDGTTRLHKDGADLFPFSGLGTMAETVIAPENAAVKVPADTPLDKAALVGCAVMTGVGAVFNTAQVTPGSRVAVFGTGGVGLNAIQGAAIAGAEQVIAVDVNARKLEFAKGFGATHVVDASKGDPGKAIKEITDGIGPDFTFEAIGRKEHRAGPRRSPQGRHLCRDRRGLLQQSVSLNAFLLPISRSGSWAAWERQSAPRHSAPPRAVSREARSDELVTRTCALDEVNEAFEDMNRGVNARGVILF